MKLKEVLKVIPDPYLIGLADADLDGQIVVFGNKKDVIWGYGQHALLIPEQVENLNVIAIHPGVNTYLRDSDMYGDASTELHVKTQLLIELSTDEETKDD